MGLLLPDGRRGRRAGAARAVTGVGWPLSGAVLTNRIALWIGLLLLAAISADLALNGGAALVFLLRKFLDMVEWLAFWR